MQCFLSLVGIFAFSQNVKNLSTVNVDVSRCDFRNALRRNVFLSECRNVEMFFSVKNYEFINKV